MSVIKEFREFFLRNSKLNTGSKKDQEIGYANTYLVDAKTVYNRFLKGDYPSEDVFRKLFESITFKLNPEDKATVSVQGLTIIADDDNAIAKTDETTFTGAVVSHQLPEVVLSVGGGDTALTSATTVNGITIRPYKRVVGGKARIVYLLTVPAIPGSATQTYTLLNNSITTSNSSGANPETLKTYTLPASTIATNYDKFKVKASFVHGVVTNSFVIFNIKIGGTAIASFVNWNDNQDIYMEADCTRATSGTLVVDYKISFGSNTSPLAPKTILIGTAGISKDLTSPQAIIAEVGNTGGIGVSEVTCRQLTVEYFKQ